MASNQYSTLLYQAKTHLNHHDPDPHKSQMQSQYPTALSKGTPQSYRVFIQDLSLSSPHTYPEGSTRFLFKKEMV